MGYGRRQRQKEEYRRTLNALTMNLKLTSRANKAQDQRIEKLTASIEKLIEVSNRDAVDISALARIASAHERRPENLEGERG